MKAKKGKRVLVEPTPQRIHSQTMEMPIRGETKAETPNVAAPELPPVALVTLTYVPSSDGIHVQLHFPKLLSNDQMLHILQRAQEFVIQKKLESAAKEGNQT